MTTWFKEAYGASEGRALSVLVKSLLYKKISQFQTIEIFDTVCFGRMLVLDGVIMMTQFDNFAYHEMIVHVPMQAHPNPRKVLVIGGGDGGTINQLLKYPQVEVTLCEIDEEVILVCKEWFPEYREAFEKVKIQIDDGSVYLRHHQNEFDVICVDSSDPVGPAEVLFKKPFYQDIYNALTPEGIAVTQSESMYYDLDFIKNLLVQNKEIFKFVDYYYTLIPTYPSGTIGFSFCSKQYDYLENLKSERVSCLTGLNYYSKSIHQAAFEKPRFFYF